MSYEAISFSRTVPIFARLTQEHNADAEQGKAGPGLTDTRV